MPAHKKGRGRRGAASNGTEDASTPLAAQLVASPSREPLWKLLPGCPLEEAENGQPLQLVCKALERDLLVPAKPVHGVAGWLQSGAELDGALSWFVTGAQEDSNASLAFSPGLSKQQRARVHRAVEAKFSAELETASVGVGDARTICVFKRGHAPKKEATEEQQDKAGRLYKYACDAGMGAQVSRDELLERVKADALPEALAQLWEVREAQQRVMDRIMAAVEADDPGSLQVLVESDAAVAELLALGVRDVESGDLPLHAAARMGSHKVIRLLVDLGAQLEAPNGQGKTPLKVARMFEQTDSEAVLLQLGAHDPDAGRFPMNVQAAQLGLPSQLLTGLPVAPEQQQGNKITVAGAHIHSASVQQVPGKDQVSTPDDKDSAQKAAESPATSSHGPRAAWSSYTVQHPARSNSLKAWTTPVVLLTVAAAAGAVGMFVLRYKHAHHK